MAKTTGNTAEKVREIVLPVCEEMGLNLWDVTFEKEGADWFLKVLVEKKEGLLDITEAEAFSRRIDPLIDEADPIDQSYFLEVGSPGLNRKLRTPEHFERYVGSEVYVRLIRPDSEGRKEIEGTLDGFSDGNIKLGDIDIRLADAAFVRLND
ncbi:MAG: ribosome maturation factor RimP [Oscillospiraceae bacterium]|nr:ribosome maturation factor RimP [Oscillospiraceae bacterium]